MTHDADSPEGNMRNSVSSLPLLTYVTVGFALGLLSTYDYFASGLVVDNHVRVDATEKGEQLDYLNKIVWRIWLCGAITFSTGVVVVLLKRKWVIVIIFLLAQAALAVTIFYFDSKIVEVVGGP